MAVRKLKPDVYSVGAIHWDVKLFDQIIPLPDGTTYNSYLIKGSEKTALIDTVNFGKEDELLNNLRMLNVDRIDYIIANHAEQDHTGSLRVVLKHFPEAKVITNPKCKEFISSIMIITPFKVEESNDEFL